jgi:hypothetical protein
VFSGGQSVVHLTKISAYQNGIMYPFIRQVIDEGRMVHTGENRAVVFM